MLMQPCIDPPHIHIFVSVVHHTSCSIQYSNRTGILNAWAQGNLCAHMLSWFWLASSFGVLLRMGGL